MPPLDDDAHTVHNLTFTFFPIQKAPLQVEHIGQTEGEYIDQIVTKRLPMAMSSAPNLIGAIIVTTSDKEVASAICVKTI